MTSATCQLPPMIPKICQRPLTPAHPSQCLPTHWDSWQPLSTPTTPSQFCQPLLMPADPCRPLLTPSISFLYLPNLPDVLCQLRTTSDACQTLVTPIVTSWFRSPHETNEWWITDLSSMENSHTDLGGCFCACRYCVEVSRLIPNVCELFH